jgi:alpha-beta hydrolase superfamily lysophospholipase
MLNTLPMQNQPVAFAGCRGWLSWPHHAVAPVLRGGIVFFGAYGLEDLATRYSLAKLANQLAAQGYAVLRFDLPGTGDSLDDPTATPTVAHWVQAGCQAVAALQAWLGGVDAPVSQRAVHALALLAPVVQGRHHLREWRILSSRENPLQVAGFALNDELQAQWLGLDLLQLAHAPCAHVFFGIPDMAKGLDALQTQWTHQSRMVTAPYPQLQQHIGNPTLSQTPEDLWRSCLQWFNGLDAKQHPAWQPRPAVDPLLVGPDFEETALMLPWQDRGLAAVWCRPQKARKHQGARQAVVVFCNAGRNPHTGWARGTVQMARQLAQQGIASIRFDLAGLGDSPPLAIPPAEVLYATGNIPQLQAVLAHVQTQTADGTPICVVGACSGGHLAFHAAVSDARVSALVLVNVQRFVWQQGMSLQAAMRAGGHSTQTYRNKLFQLNTWRRFFQGQVDAAFVLRALWGRWLARRLQAKAQPSGIRQGFESLAKRGCQVAVIYSEQDAGRDEFASHMGQNAQHFTQLAQTALHVLPHADHDLSDPAARHFLLQTIVRVCK